MITYRQLKKAPTKEAIMNELQKKSKLQLWIILCNAGIIKGDCSIYLMNRYTKKDLLELLEVQAKNK